MNFDSSTFRSFTHTNPVSWQTAYTSLSLTHTGWIYCSCSPQNLFCKLTAFTEKRVLYQGRSLTANSLPTAAATVLISNRQTSFFWRRQQADFTRDRRPEEEVYAPFIWPHSSSLIRLCAAFIRALMSFNDFGTER